MEIIEGIFMFLLFACGAFAGFIGGAMIGTQKREKQEFDGGYMHDHPRVMTKIWSRDINTEDKP